MEVIPSLISAIEAVMSPDTNQQNRESAQKILEEFKETSPVCVQCGLTLSQTMYNPVARHFGLQLVEHSVKFKWNSFSQEDKDQLKKSSLELIAGDTLGILDEFVYVKDGLSKVVVEIIKREWPQLWPSLLKDLYDLCQMGPTQTELVLKIYLRLVEDVVVFQNLPTQRRREVLQGLTASMGDLFELFVTLLEQNSSAIKEKTPSMTAIELAERQVRCQVSQAVLSTLTGYLDWVAMSHIFIRNGELLQILCLLLSNKDLQLHAAECLLVIVSRKGKVEDRKPLMILFSEDAMSLIWNAAIAADHESKDEHYYLFLKRLCQVLIELGKQLCVLWGPVQDVVQPPTFSKYLDAVLAFTQHPAQMISIYTLSLWVSLLQHTVISNNPVLMTFIPKLFETATKTLFKVGFPTQNNSPSCEYSRLEFDSDEEFNLFFSKYRSEWSNMFRLATVLNPGVAFQFADQWLRSVLSKPIDTGKDNDGVHCTLSSPSFLEWDAASVFLEGVMSRMFTSKAENKPDPQQGVSLLNCVLNFDANDPLVLSSLLSCISALFPYLSNTPETLPVVLKKIFSAVTFSQDGQTKATRSRAVKNVRQHACSIVVKICKQYTDLIFPVFDQLYNHIREIGSDVEQLSQMEKCILMEALILVSNKFCNFERQSAFIDEMLKPAKDLWLSQEFKEAFWSTEKFMSYVGVDRAPVEPSSADTCGINRSHITSCINTILAVMKRSNWPDSPQEAVNGGFVLSKLEDGTVIYRNPATSHVSLLLENLLMLMKTMNSLYHPDFLQRRHPEFVKSYDLNEVEKLTILGIPPPCVDMTQSVDSKKPVDRMQNFLTTTHDNSCHILGNAGQCLGYEFYTVPNLSQLLLNTVFTNLQFLPDFRTKILIMFMKSYVQHCPPSCYQTAVVPILEVLCQTIYQILSSKWQQILERGSGDEDNQESQEVVEDHLTRQLTKEYLDLLINIVHEKKTVEPSDDIGEEEVVQTPTNPREETVSVLGKLCLNNESIYPSLLMFTFSCLSWSDTSVCNRSTGLCYSLLKQFHTDQKTTAELAMYFFTSVLKGLQTHGQHEELQSSLLLLGVQTYELLRPTFPDITQVLLQVPNTTADHIKSFDNMLSQQNNQKQLNEKKKKDVFRKIVGDIIGKSIGEMFKREIHYRNLPTLFTNLRKKHQPLDAIEPQNLGICDLFNPSNGT